MFHCPFEKKIFFLSSNFHNFLLLHHDRTFNCEFIIIRGTLLIQLSGEYFPFESPLSVICLHKRKKENFSWKKTFPRHGLFAKSTSGLRLGLNLLAILHDSLILYTVYYILARQRCLTNVARHMQIQEEAKIYIFGMFINCESSE